MRLWKKPIKTIFDILFVKGNNTKKYLIVIKANILEQANFLRYLLRPDRKILNPRLIFELRITDLPTVFQLKSRFYFLFAQLTASHSILWSSLPPQREWYSISFTYRTPSKPISQKSQYIKLHALYLTWFKSCATYKEWKILVTIDVTSSSSLSEWWYAPYEKVSSPRIKIDIMTFHAKNRWYPICLLQ